jgi:hypothetical protein
MIVTVAELKTQLSLLIKHNHKLAENEDWGVLYALKTYLDKTQQSDSVVVDSWPFPRNH